MTNNKADKIEPQPDSCHTCRYYRDYVDLDPEDIESPDDFTGICQRYPPHVIPGVSGTSVWPDVSRLTGWCGEYMPRV